MQKNAVRWAEASTLAQLLGRFREPDNVRGGFDLAITAVPFAAIWTLMCVSLYFDCWASWEWCLPRACSSVSS